MKIGVLLYTYNRTDDARINQEIIRNVWSRCDLFKNVVIVHTFNGEKDWWPEKYLENELLYLPNPGHFVGAELLINEGIKCFTEKYPDTDYVITLAPDTWLVKPEYIENIITKLKKEDKYLATCAWGTKEKDNIWDIGMALDFSIFDLKWATRFDLFPIGYTEFSAKYSDLFYYQDKLIYPERVLALRFKQAILKSVKIPSENLLTKICEAHIYRMKEREPVHDARNFLGIIKKGRKMYWPSIGLVTYHEPEPKREILKKMNLRLGEHANRLISSKDLSYYNQGTRKTSYIKKEADLNYGD